jgi:hypothetical protein
LRHAHDRRGADRKSPALLTVLCPNCWAVLRQDIETLKLERCYGCGWKDGEPVPRLMTGAK